VLGRGQQLGQLPPVQPHLAPDIKQGKKHGGHQQDIQRLGGQGDFQEIVLPERRGGEERQRAEDHHHGGKRDDEPRSVTVLFDLGQFSQQPRLRAESLALRHVALSTGRTWKHRGKLPVRLHST